MIVLDTTVLVYAKGVGHPLRDPCRRLIDAIRTRRLRATTSVEVIQEFLHVRSRRNARAEAASRAREYAELLAPLLVLEPRHLDRGLTLFESTARLGAFDSLLAAAALDGDPARLVSADRAFAEVDGLDHVIPDEAGVTRLLA